MSQSHTAPTIPPPTKHQLALMIWVAVFPTLTASTSRWATPSPTCPAC